MADKIIIFSGKQYSGKDTLAKILLELIQVKNLVVGVGKIYKIVLMRKIREREGYYE